MILILFLSEHINKTRFTVSFDPKAVSRLEQENTSSKLGREFIAIIIFDGMAHSANKRNVFMWKIGICVFVVDKNAS